VGGGRGVVGVAGSALFDGDGGLLLLVDGTDTVL
jgi:hypothetical protein